MGSRRRWLAPVVLSAAFVTSRAAYRALGLRYDPELLYHAWQLLDPELLQTDLLRSVWYLHTQPPLFNLFVGALLQVSPLTDATTLEIAWLALGAVLTGLVYDIFRSAGTARAWALAATILITCGPGVVLYESWFAYELPLTVLLTGTVAAFARWCRHGHLSALAATVGCAATAVLSRSLLHPIWLVAVIILTLAARSDVVRARRPATAALALLPLLAVGGVMAKNQVLFDRTDLSSWMGWNLHRIAFGDLTSEEKQQLVDEGVISPDTLLFINAPVDYYEPALGECTPTHSWVPALTEQQKTPDPTQAEPLIEQNLNNECYLPVYDAFLEDSLEMIRARPRRYLRAVASAAQIWALPTTDYAYVHGNRDAVEPIETWYRHILWLDVPLDPPIDGLAIRTNTECITFPNGQQTCLVPDGQYRVALTPVLGTAAALALGAWSLWRLLRRRDLTHALWAMNALVIGWVTVAAIALEVGENHRFRSMVEPLTMITVLWLGGRLAVRIRRRITGSPAPARPGQRQRSATANEPDVDVDAIILGANAAPSSPLPGRARPDASDAPAP